MDGHRISLPLLRVQTEAHAPLDANHAIAEASACLQCGGPGAPAPCVAACPTGIDIPGFILDIAQDRAIEAAKKIFNDNVLGGSCARVCPVEVLCEGACVLKKEGRRPIQIGRLQRHATDRALDAQAPVLGPAPSWKKDRSVAVVGAGPAGLACAAELALRGFGVVVYENRDFAGGLITRGIAPYKQQIKPLPEEMEQIQRLGVEFRFGIAVGNGVSLDQLRREHQAIFLGVGMGDDIDAKIPGENLPGIWESLQFVEAIKLGTNVDVHLGHRVAIIGGGNTAIDVAREAIMLHATEDRQAQDKADYAAVDVAREALLLGAAEVMMLYRRTEAEMPAFAHEIHAAKKEGVRIVPLVAPVEFVGTDRVRGVRCVRMRLGAPDKSGRPRPEPIPGSEFVIEVDSVIKAIGQKPRTELFAAMGVELAGNLVKINENWQTSRPDIFAGGDCINGGATVVKAVHDGREAARAIDRYLTGKPRPAPRGSAPSRVEIDEGIVRHFQSDFRLTTAPRLCKGCNICVTSCPTSTLSLDPGGKIEVNDVGTCVFCGICEARCPDFAIWINRGAAERARPSLVGSEREP